MQLRVAERIYVVEFAGFDQRSDSGPVLGTTVGASEQCIFPVQRDRADGPFDGVVVELDAAVVEEPGEALPARQGVADGLGELALLAISPSFARSHDSSASISGGFSAPNDPMLIALQPRMRLLGTPIGFRRSGHFLAPNVARDSDTPVWVARSGSEVRLR